MRKLILKMSLSIDGFVGGPNGEMGWIFDSYDSEATDWSVKTLTDAGVHIMGSRTYHDMKAYWPTSTEPFAASMNQIPKVVFSKRGAAVKDSAAQTTTALADATRAKTAQGWLPSGTVSAHADTWANAKIASGNLVADIGRLRQLPGGYILAHGGTSFARSLVERDLIDEYRLLVHPVVLGQGLPLFGAAGMQALRLVSSTTFPGGAVANIYERA